ncbi:MAG: hypothetical protein KKG91_02305 [Candidatus Omnitrophica bacterium]|nr:hypothetical protein [Candidatus Omnitrophota bacterium]
MLKKRVFFDSRYHPTQVSIYLISLMVTFIFIAFMVINVGKTAKDKTYADNAADAGALSAASVMAYAFNYVANVNAGSDEDETFKKSWGEDQENGIKQEYTDHFTQADKIYKAYTRTSARAVAKTCSACFGCKQISSMGASSKEAMKTAQDIARATSYNARQYADEMDYLLEDGFKNSDENYEEKKTDGIVPSGAQEQQALLEAVRKRVHDDQKNGDDLYQNALYAGYIFNFYNSGISHRLGRINAKRYEAFLKEITPDNVNNCEEKTFSWADGAGRFHTVTAIICIDDAQSYKLEITKDNRDAVKNNLDEARKQSDKARQAAGNEPMDQQYPAGQSSGTSAETHYAEAADDCGCARQYPYCMPHCCIIPDTCTDTPILCPSHNSNGDIKLLATANPAMIKADSAAKKAKAGLDGRDEKDYDKKNDSEPDIIKWIKDINHDRKVTSCNYQFHMGGPVKGMRGDIDFPTFYPPVQSQATADFSGNGDIEKGQAAFDVRLESAN